MLRASAVALAHIVGPDLARATAERLHTLLACASFELHAAKYDLSILPMTTAVQAAFAVRGSG